MDAATSNKTIDVQVEEGHDFIVEYKLHECNVDDMRKMLAIRKANKLKKEKQE